MKYNVADLTAIATTMPPGITARGTSTDKVYRWLHVKPLDSAIGRVLAPYRPGGRHGHRRCRWSKHNTKHSF